MSTINRYTLDSENETINKEDVVKKIAIRDKLLTQILNYSSQLSQELWIDCANNLIPKIRQLEWTTELYFEFLQYQRLIDRKGILQAGTLIILNLRELCKQS